MVHLRVCFISGADCCHFLQSHLLWSNDIDYNSNDFGKGGKKNPKAFRVFWFEALSNSRSVIEIVSATLIGIVLCHSILIYQSDFVFLRVFHSNFSSSDLCGIPLLFKYCHFYTRFQICEQLINLGHFFNFVVFKYFCRNKLRTQQYFCNIAAIAEYLFRNEIDQLL